MYSFSPIALHHSLATTLASNTISLETLPFLFQVQSDWIYRFDSATSFLVAFTQQTRIDSDGRPTGCPIWAASPETASLLPWVFRPVPSFLKTRGWSSEICLWRLRLFCQNHPPVTSLGFDWY